MPLIAESDVLQDLGSAPRRMTGVAAPDPMAAGPGFSTTIGDVMRTQTGAVVAGTLNSIAAMDRDSIKATLGSKEVSGAVVAMANSPDWGKASAAFSFMDQIDRKMPLDFNELFGEKAAASLDEWKHKLSFVPPARIVGKARPVGIGRVDGVVPASCA